MEVVLSQLVSNSMFNYGGKTYIIGGKIWSSSATENYIGKKGARVTLLECHPKLGGQFQSNISIWVSGETTVTVN